MGKCLQQLNDPKLKSFNALTNEYSDQHFSCFIKAGSAIGDYIEPIGDGQYRNPFEDKEYNVSLKKSLAVSYQNMINPTLGYNYSIQLISLVKEYSNRYRNLTVEESSTLAEKSCHSWNDV